jgi:tetratricopeptide (TPR) repeat protein
MTDWQDPEEFLERADRLLEEGAYEEALEACRQAIKVSPDLADARAMAGRCLAYLNRVDEAERELLKAVDADHNCVDAWFGLAFVSWLRADDREAVGHLERARRLAPDDEAVLAQLIGTYGNVGRFDEAERLYEEAIGIHPDSAEIPYHWGLVLFKHGRYDQAIDVWHRAGEADDEFPELHLSMARAFAARGDDEQAYAELERELALYPDSREARLALGGYHVQHGEPKRAVEVYRDLLAEAEDDSRVHLDLGVALIHLGHDAKARKHLLRALELSPSDPLILSHLTSAGHSRSAMTRAARVLRRALREEPHRDELYRNLSSLFAGEGRFDEAEEQLRQAMAFSGRAHELENDLGVLLAIQGKFREASDAFDRGLAARPDDLPLRINRALIEADLGRRDLALEQLGRIARASPDDLDALGNLSSVLLEVGRIESSLTVAERMCDLAPFDPRGYYLTGRALYDLGRYEDAERALDRGARLDPIQVDTAIALGMCYAALGRPADCLRVFERARRLAPNDPDVLFNLGLAYEDAAATGPDEPAAADEQTVSTDDAVALYRRVLDLAPSYQGARDRLEALGAEPDPS